MLPYFSSLSETDAWLFLHRLPGISRQDIVTLYQDVQQDLSALIAEIFDRASRANKSNILDYYNTSHAALFETCQKQLLATDASVICWNNSNYPELLREISSPPLVLFVKGQTDALLMPAIAMVGSRSPSVIGKENAYAFACCFAENKLCIVSGLAEGIDAASHRGALAGNGKTVAVMGTGIDKIYPMRHAKLAAEIVDAGGLLLTEFLPDTPPRPKHFPQRNRIISGLALGTLVIEAAEKSGSLITARFANEQGRSVFALPGSIHSVHSKGCHALIRQGAKLVENAGHVIEDLLPQWCSTLPSADGTMPSTLDEAAQNLLACIDFAPTPEEIILHRSHLTAETLAPKLVELLLAGHIAQTAGGYIRCK